jgi:succinyl-diaminopimelate desuccinylase
MSGASPPATGGSAVDGLADLTKRLVDIPSVSHSEGPVADFVEEWLRSLGGSGGRGSGSRVLEVERIGDNVCARTNFGLSQRLMLAGHLDTVPPNGNERARLDGELIWGLGSADMKGGDAVFLEIARALAAASADGRPASLLTDLTWVFYVCEEVDRRHSGLVEIEASSPGWLAADAAVLGEPTGALVEAGCQGVLRVVVELAGERAHTARPWMGRNAIHGLAPVLDTLRRYEGRRPTIDGCEYREALQAVAVTGGVANNVVPDASRLVINHRFAPDRSADEAFESVRDLLMGALGDADVKIELEDSASAAAPGLDHPVLAGIVAASGEAPRAKLGWTDVSFFAERGVPAMNFGPGEPTLAHRADEHVPIAQLGAVYRALASAIGLA